MTEKPIIFSAPMVRAILAGRKTQTRRLLRWPAWCGFDAPAQARPDGSGLYCGDSRGSFLGFLSPPYEVGWHLWVKETFYLADVGFTNYKPALNCTDPEGRPRTVGYAASMDGDSERCARDYGVKKTPSIFMPRWASRLTLEVTAVRVERLQDISEADARAEGVSFCSQPLTLQPGEAATIIVPRARECFATLWDSINGKRAEWASNPWVAVVSFGMLDGEDPAHM